MNPDPDEHAPPGQESLLWGDGIKEKNRDKAPSSGYTVLSEQARRMFPGESKCRMFCGGKVCKYCTAHMWKPEQMVIDGVFSEWVTHNILAMARMSNNNISKYKMTQQLHKLGVKTIINLQEPGEHAFCGFGNDSSGFSYNPQTLMEAGIFYYNFAIRDYGITSMANMLDIVKVMQFALSEGKVAVHCHAGLGRTGMLIACYLIYNNRVKASKCIQYVRSRRRGAIQTKQQMGTCLEFEEYLRLFYIIFPCRISDTPSFSFSHFLNRQRHLLHGYEGRKLKHIPKVIYICLERLLELCRRGHALSSLRHKQTDPLTEGILAMDEKGSDQKSDLELDEENPLLSCDTVPFSAHNKLFMSIPQDILGKTDSSPSLSRSHNKHLPPLSSKKVGRRRHAEEENGDDDEDDYRNFHHHNVRRRKESDDSEDNDHDISTLSESVGVTLDVEDVCFALTAVEYSDSVTKSAISLEEKLNQTDEAWRQLAWERSPLLLCHVMWDWLDQLNEPILRAQDISILIQHSHDLSRALSTLEKSTKHFLEYLARVFSRLQPISPPLMQQVLQIGMCHLTQKRHGDTVYPPSSSLSSLIEEKPDTSFQLFDLLLQMIERENMRS